MHISHVRQTEDRRNELIVVHCCGYVGWLVVVVCGLSETALPWSWRSWSDCVNVRERRTCRGDVGLVVGLYVINDVSV